MDNELLLMNNMNSANTGQLLIIIITDIGLICTNCLMIDLFRESTKKVLLVIKQYLIHFDKYLFTYYNYYAYN